MAERGQSKGTGRGGAGGRSGGGGERRGPAGAGGKARAPASGRGRSGTAGAGAGPNKAAGGIDAKLARRDRLVRAGHGGPGVPRAIERAPTAAPTSAVAEAEGHDARRAHLLDLLAFFQHGRLAARVDLRAHRATMPPLVLADGDGPIIALDDAAALHRLASRSRAFSQIAARYAALALVSRETQRPLRVELWDLDALDDPSAAVPGLRETATALSRYHEAEFTLGEPSALALLRQGLSLPAPGLPAVLVKRNPLAWLLVRMAPTESGA